jgi:hypothetical protein
MGGLADGRVIHVKIGANGPHDHLARVQPHTDAERDAVLTPDALGVSFH